MSPPMSPPPPLPPPPTSPPPCPICLERTCNHWAIMQPTEDPRTICLLLEEQYGCDCTGCECLDIMPPPPTPLPPPMPPQRPPLAPSPFTPPPASPEDRTAQIVGRVFFILVVVLCCASCFSVAACTCGWLDPGARKRRLALPHPLSPRHRDAHFCGHALQAAHGQEAS